MIKPLGYLSNGIPVCNYRDFKLHLKPNKRFSTDFAAYAIDKDGNKNRFPVNQDEYYHGCVHGE